MKTKSLAHDFRDFLQGTLEKVEVNPNLVSPMLGHKVKGVDKHYSNHDIEEFLQVFVKALPLLVPLSVEQVRAESLQKLEEEKKAITSLEYENNELKTKINQVHTEVKEQDVAQKEEIKALKDQISSMYEFTHKNIDPVLDVIDELSKMPEGAEALRKLQAKKQVQREEEDEKSRTED